MGGHIGARKPRTSVVRGRRIVSGVGMALVASFAVAAVPSGFPPQAAGGALASPAHGDFAGQVALGGGRKLFLRCKGSGRPAVFLESGIHDSSDPWTLTQAEPPVVSSPSVFAGVARFTRVCTYDRPGTIRYTDPPRLTTRSTPVEMPRALPAMASDLRTLLRKSGIRGPYTLVGHSFGGMITQLFAQTNPSQVAGLVLVDAFGASIRRRFGTRLWPAYVDLVNHPGTPFDSDPRFETIDIDGSIDAVRRAAALPRTPLAVMSKTEPFGTAPGVPRALLRRLEQVWPRVQGALVKLRPQTPHILATGSDHYVQMHAPDLTISTVRLIVERARNQR